MLRVVIAPSGFKESLSAEQAAAAIAAGVRRACADAEIVELPLADGGEGFSQTMVDAVGGEIRKVRVANPIGETIDSHFGILKNDNKNQRIAVLEMAAAAGLTLVPKDKRDPLATTTFGVGELIKAALDAGATEILLGCGDSGTNDGGAGAAQALGARLLKSDGSDIERGGAGLAELAKIDVSGLDARLKTVKINVACNIENILCGARGVARVFGPQKGASAETVETLSSALDNFADVIEKDLEMDVREMPGGGASGGMGAGVYALLGGKLHSRFDIIFKYFKLDEALKNADLVLTAEGGINFQTPHGKIPSEVAHHARDFGIPVIALAGSVGEGAEENYEHGINAMFSILNEPGSLENAIENAAVLLEQAAENAIRAVLVGREIAAHEQAAQG